MNKQVIAVGLLAALLAPATQGFAQKVPIKKIKPVKITRTVTQSVERLVPRVPGVYIPAGTLAYSLENKVASVAKKANIHLTSSEINIIASNPERLRQFQAEANMPIFEGRPVPYKEELKILKANQEKFTAARANNEYEPAWEEFIKQNAPVPSRQGKNYEDPKTIANDVYNFYKANDIDLAAMPRIRMIGANDIEGTVLELPVDDLFLVRHHPFEIQREVSADKFVVVHFDNGRNQVLFRKTLVAVENGQPVGCFRVIK